MPPCRRTRRTTSSSITRSTSSAACSRTRLSRRTRIAAYPTRAEARSGALAAPLPSQALGGQGKLMADELTRPLGLDPPQPRLRRAAVVAIVAPLVVAVAVASYVWLGRDPGAGEPAVTAPIAGVAKGEETGSVPLKRGKPRVADSGPVDPSAPGLSEVAPGGGEVVIHDAGNPDPTILAAVPRQDLVEKTRYGLLPRIADDGTRPLQAYARPV